MLRTWCLTDPPSLETRSFSGFGVSTTTRNTLPLHTNGTVSLRESTRNGVTKPKDIYLLRLIIRIAEQSSKNKLGPISQIFIYTEYQPLRKSWPEWIKQRRGTYIMEYYSAVKKDSISLFVIAWRDLENMMLSEISQAEKDKYHIISLICGI